MARFTLNTRLVGEACKAHGQLFGTPQALHRRLKKLCDARLLRSYPFPVSGGLAYHLGKDSRAFFGDDVPPRACSPVRIGLQSHEFEVSRFWLKFLGDARSLQLSPQWFIRDGQLKLNVGNRFLVPDGTILLRIRGRAHVFFLELDRSTQTSGAGGQSGAVLRDKFLGYKQHSRIKAELETLHGVPAPSVTVITVCQNEKRLQSLLEVAEKAGFTIGAAFTCLPRFLKQSDPFGAWTYRRANLFSAPLFSFPSRSPPGPLLS